VERSGHDRRKRAGKNVGRKEWDHTKNTIRERRMKDAGEKDLRRTLKGKSSARWPQAMPGGLRVLKGGARGISAEKKGGGPGGGGGLGFIKTKREWAEGTRGESHKEDQRKSGKGRVMR